MSRSNKAFKNIMTGLMNKIVLMLLAFVTRTSFIRLLGAEYIGVNSLYTNILSVLSLAELGIGNVLMFYLYPVLNNHDEIKIKSLVGLFRKIYAVIVLVILVLGMLFIPLLKVIVRSDLDAYELIIYYLLYLFNSVASYFVIYRTMVLNADQKSYISNLCSATTTIVMYLLQIISLLILHSFLVYLIIQVICTIFNNFIVNTIACRHYPYLRRLEKFNWNFKETSFEKKELFKNIKATFLFKISDTILDQTDNIIISIMFGTIFVGYYSNYYLLITYLVNVGGIIANGLVASYGNLNIEGNKDKSFQMFKVCMHLFSSFGRICTVTYAAVIQDFIPLWIGEQYVMDDFLVIAILIAFYLRMATNTVWIYRATMGLFKEVQYINVFSAIINIFLSIVGGQLFGISGVIAATFVSRFVTSFWFEGRIVFKRLNKKVSIYFKQQGKDFFVCLLNLITVFVFCTRINANGLSGIILKIVCSVMIWILFELLFYRKTESYQILLNKLVTIYAK